MNASLPKPTEPTSGDQNIGGSALKSTQATRPAQQPTAQPLQKGVVKQVAQTAKPDYKPGQLPTVKKTLVDQAAPVSKTTSTSLPKLPKPLSSSPQPLSSSKPAIKPVAKPAVPDLNKSPVGVMAAKPVQPVQSAKPVVSQAKTQVKSPAAPQAKPLSAPPKTATPPVTPPKPLIAKAGKDPKKMALIGLIAIFVISLVGFGISKLFGGGSKTATTPGDNQVAQQPTKQTIVTYWGLWESSAVLEEVLSDFEVANPGIKVDYRVQSHKDYRERLQTAIASGNGPDAFRYHASWVPMLGGSLAVMPASVMSATEFKNSFYPVAAKQLQIEGKIVGIPLMYDGLGLYYNKEVLATAGVEPPETWAELKQLANELTVPNDKKERKGGLQRSGLAIGNASNVEHYSDILGLLILQNGGDPSTPSSTEVKDALTFYTNFIKQDSIWDSSLPSSTVAFARGEAVMMFAPSWRAHEVMELNPNLDFGIASLPQLSDEKVTWSTYWAEGVNEKSRNKNEAWVLLKYLSSAEVMKKLYSSQSQTRAFGEPYSRVDLAGDLTADPYVGAILGDANYAVGLYMNSFTHDNGLNDQVNEYYTGAINTFLQGGDQEDALITLEKGVLQVLSQYY